MTKNLEEIKERNLIVFPAKIKKEKKNEAPKNDFVSCNVFPKKKGKEKKNEAPKNGELPDSQRTIYDSSQ